MSTARGTEWRNDLYDLDLYELRRAQLPLVDRAGEDPGGEGRTGRREEMTCSLYEQTRFRNAVGAEFRPGGLGLTQELATVCAPKPGQRVLDVGCGVGSTASFLSRRWGVTSVGLDSSARSIEEASACDNTVGWVVGRAQEIPYPDCYFDAVFAECFLSTLDDPAQVLREIRRVLRPCGRLAVADMYLRTPEAASSLRPLPSTTCLHGAVGREATLALLERAGFTVRIWRDRSGALKTLMASLIFAYGSADAFWDAALGSDKALRESVARARPGYYLLIAEPQSISV